MDDLKEIFKKFMEIQKAQNQKNDDVPAQGDEGLAALEGKIQDAGFNPDEIRELMDDFSPDEDLNKVVEDIFKIIGREITFKKPIKVTDDGFISESTSTKETDQGLERTTEKPLIIASCGKVIREEDIGVKCSICGQYDEKEHSFVCYACGNGLCIRHVYFFKNEKDENIPYCSFCFHKKLLNESLW